MAKRTIPAREEVTDDVTGKPVDAQAETISGTFGKDKFSLDLAPETANALRAFLTDPTDDNRRTLGALIPRPRVGSGSGSRAASNGAGKREWLRANGWPEIGSAGKFSAEQEAAYAAAHPAAPAPQEPAPAA